MTVTPDTSMVDAAKARAAHSQLATGQRVL